MSDILKNIRKLNWLLQESPTGAFSFSEMCEILSDILNANVYVVNQKGKVLGDAYKIKSDSSTVKDKETGEEAFPSEYNEEFMKLRETKANLSGEHVLDLFKHDYDTTDKIHTLVPILSAGRHWGTVILTRYEPEFSDEDLVLSEYGATVIGQEIHRKKSEEEERERQLQNMVKMAIGTLSYSEVEAVSQIFDALDGDEGLLVASRIADRSGITRSVIVNALRKLESAGIIETRSLGMKGTRIKVLNSKFKSELARQEF